MKAQELTLVDLLKHGVHFGHQTSKWHPKMEPYLFNSRNGVHIINLEKSLEQLKLVAEQVKKMTKEGKVILFLGTKRQAKEIIKKWATFCGAPYINERWLGGLFTNFSVVSQLMRKLKNLKKQKETGELGKYTKKEQLDFGKEIERLEKFVGGMIDLKNIPDAMFIVGMREEKTAVREAQKKKVPIVGIADSNVNPEELEWVIPGNDDATKSIELLVSVVAEAVKEGKEQAEQKEAVETKPVAASAS